MRQRRAERLLLRAEAALDAGFIDDAKNALAEARRLSPEQPEIDRIAGLIDAAESAAAHESFTRTRTFYIATAIAALLLVCALAGVWWAWRSNPTAPLETEAANTAAETPPPAAAAGGAPEVRVVSAAVTPAIIAVTPAEPSATPDVARSTSSKPGDVVMPPPTLSDPVTPLTRPVTEIAPATALPAKTVALSDLSATSPVSNIPDIRTAAAAPVAPVPTPTPMMNNDAVLVRGVLDKYAAAYTRLDVEAARAAWPSVNVAALSRAFDGLASQQVSLGNCSVDVKGVTARAACDGSATWQPKVGGGLHTDPRTWTFDLARAGSEWQIVSARVQNR